MFEDIIKTELSKKDIDKPDLVRDVEPYASWDAMEYHAAKPHIIRAGFERALSSMGINVSINFELLDKLEDEPVPRWCFHIKLKD